MEILVSAGNAPCFCSLSGISLTEGIEYRIRLGSENLAPDSGVV